MPDKSKKSRGRPKLSNNPSIVQSDEVIAKTVYRLLMVGFPLRNHGNQPEVAELTAIVAKNILQRSDSNGLALSSNRIKQIYEEWFNRKKLETSSKTWPVPQRWRYTKESLHERCPVKHKTLLELVEILIHNNGEWPKKIDPPIPSGDLILTPKANRFLGQPPVPKLIFDDSEK